jgi:uncharacterized protein (DUF736 family)
MKWRLIPPNKSNPKYRLQRSVNGGVTWQKANHQSGDALNVLLKTPLPVHPLTRASEEGDSWADELTLEIFPQAIPALPAVMSVARHAKSFFDLW